MSRNRSISYKPLYNDEILEQLLEDPTRSIREIAQELNSYRQRVWRTKKTFEDKHVIWGYTAVVDEAKLNHVMYLLLLKTQPMNKELAEILIERIENQRPRKQNIRLLDMFYVNGEYDWVLRFSAPDHSTARKYYDTIRLVYKDHLLEKPIMVDLNFCLVAEGKANPELRRLYDFIPR